VSGLIRLGYRKTLEQGDLWDVAAADAAQPVADAFLWNLAAADGVVWRAMWRTHGRAFVLGALPPGGGLLCSAAATGRWQQPQPHCKLALSRCMPLPSPAPLFCCRSAVSSGPPAALPALLTPWPGIRFPAVQPAW
jgi:hypothetical protein